MIKIRYAKFSNFRGLRDVRIDFSTRDDKPLTVIRAANYTGKTTLLYGLTWGLFGDPGLPVPPRRRGEYRLSPIDWQLGEGGVDVSITAEIGLTVVDDNSSRPTYLETEYTLLREGRETITGETFQPQETSYKLIRHDPEGDREIQDADRMMDRVLLPAAKKDIFFVDGDARVNQYFSNDEADSQENIKGAVRHLLSLDVVVAARDRMNKVLADVNRKIKKEAQGTQIEKLAGDLEKAQSDYVAAQKRFEEAAADHRNSQQDVDKYEKLQASALAAGGQEAQEIGKALEAAKVRLKEANDKIPKSNADMRNFLNAHQLYEQLAYSGIYAASTVYERMRAERKIPNVMPEMIKERLEAKECICGADLSPGTEGCARLTQELHDVEQHSESRAHLGVLANSASGVLVQDNSTMLVKSGESALSGYVEVRGEIEKLKDDIAGLEHKAKMKASAGADLELAQNNLKIARESEKNNNVERIKAGSEKERLEKEVSRLQLELSNLTKKKKQFANMRANLRAAGDIQEVLAATNSILIGETIDEVSSRMDDLFRRMIAADPEADGVVREVRLKRDFTLEAYGPDERKLVAQTDLSAAQQQSLTVSLIMALIEVSGETSPTVIDTPLGRTSGPVRLQFLEETLELEKLRNGVAASNVAVPQKVLIMTPEEIKGVEDMLEEALGAVVTLTNSQHYPAQLVHEPDTEYLEIFACGCGPRSTQYCTICERKEWS